MTGFERLKEQVKDQEDKALLQTIDYLLSREDMEQKYLNKEKQLRKWQNSYIIKELNIWKMDGIILLTKLFTHGL